MTALRSYLRPSNAPNALDAVPLSSHGLRVVTGRKHECIFHTVQLEIHIYSPSVKVLKLQGQGALVRVPVFGDYGKINGSLAFDSRSCISSGRITLCLEGSFLFSRNSPDNALKNTKQKHIFFTSSQTLSTEDPRNGKRPLWERRPYLPMMASPPQFVPFTFDIPRPAKQGQEMPPTFKVSSVNDGKQENTRSEHAEVSYTVTALWEADDGSDRAMLEVPIVFQPDTEFHSLDEISLGRCSWLELPLRTDQCKIPLHCAITLPDPAACSRSASIPYFVVFTTHPRSHTLSREVAADATIVVSLLRTVNINICRPFTVVSPLALEPASASKKKVSPSAWSPIHDDDDFRPTTPTSRLIKRAVKSAPTRLITSRDGIHNFTFHMTGKASSIHSPAVSETQTLQTDMCIGFPKRPRNRIGLNDHPSLNGGSSLPDGLYKGKIELNTNMIPSIDWAGLNVKYYLDVSVLFNGTIYRARVPVRIF